LGLRSFGAIDPERGEKIIQKEWDMADTSGELKVTQNRIQKIEADLASILKRIPDHEKQQADAEQDIAKYRADASNGNEAARKKYDAAKVTADLHRDRVRDLKVEASKLQDQLAEAKTKLQWLEVKEKKEGLIGDTAKLRAIATELSDALAVPAAKLGDLKKQIKQTYVIALPLLGDPQRVKALGQSISQAPDHAVRALLQKSFAAVGIDLFDSKRYQDLDFESVMQKPINDLMAAIETSMHTDSNTPVAGRAMFRARTQVSALFGMHLSPNDVVSLEVNHPDVVKMVAAGGLEQISEAKEATA
jgi:DNA repair exonuclease SbcCD ATPase subunit